MSPRQWLSRLGLAAFATAGLYWLVLAPLTAHTAPTEGGPGEVIPPPAGKSAWLGSASCGASACHGSDGARGTTGTEFYHWMADRTQDKHSRAYSVLLSDRSRGISERYYLGKANYPAPHRDGLCLNCHVHPGFDPKQADAATTTAFGVGCESCHGPAGGWLDKHHRPEWRSLPAEEKTKFGWQETRDLVHRVDSCIQCHVGVPGQEVNHDLLGAGHPRLNFEFAAYHATMPHHWSDQKDREMYPAFEAQAWQFGQLKTAEAAMVLLAHRAENPKGTWPEFAEYDCYACHHDLKSDSWRQKRGYGNRLPGSLPPNEWYTKMLPHAAQGQVAGLEGVQAEMSKITPDRAVLARAARKAAADLAARAKVAQPPTARQLLERFDVIAGQAGPKAADSWDDAAQVYMALAAYHQAWTDLKAEHSRAAEVRQALLDLGVAVRRPDVFDQPAAANRLEKLKDLSH